jgi:hypothetical protein
VIPRAAEYIFERFAALEAQARAAGLQLPSFHLSCSFLELYQEKFYDLLATRADRTSLRLVDLGSQGAELQGATVDEVPSHAPRARAHSRLCDAA